MRFILLAPWLVTCSLCMMSLVIMSLHSNVSMMQTMMLEGCHSFSLLTSCVILLGLLGSLPNKIVRKREFANVGIVRRRWVAQRMASYVLDKSTCGWDASSDALYPLLAAWSTLYLSHFELFSYLLHQLVTLVRTVGAELMVVNVSFLTRLIIPLFCLALDPTIRRNRSRIVSGWSVRQTHYAACI